VLHRFVSASRVLLALVALLFLTIGPLLLAAGIFVSEAIGWVITARWQAYPFSQLVAQLGMTLAGKTGLAGLDAMLDWLLAAHASLVLLAIAIVGFIVSVWIGGKVEKALVDVARR
jgi:hypothetical protein